MKPLLVLATSLLSAGLLWLPRARTADTANPASDARCDAVLKHYVQALGGREALEQITNSIANATLTMSGMELPLEVLRAVPARQATRIEIPGMGAVHEVFDGQRAWSANPFAGNSEKAGEELAKTARDAAFHQPLRMKELFAPLAYLRAQTLDGRAVEILEARMAGGAVERFYFDADNGLLVRRDTEFDAAAGRVKTEGVFEDYRAVDGVKQSHRMRLKIEAADQAPMDLQIKITALRQNVVLPANAFAQPQ
jgi:hypothetical protein